MSSRKRSTNKHSTRDPAPHAAVSHSTPSRSADLHSADSHSATKHDGARQALLAGVTALYVARPLIPSEAVAWLGDGQPFAMLWLFAAVLASLAALSGKIPRLTIVPIDMAVAALVACQITSSVWGARQGSPRPSVNMLWESLALVAGYYLVRVLVRRAVEVRALVAVMIALAVVMSSYGYYQYFIGLPADRAEYARNPERMLRDSDQWYPPGSKERQQFENRLNSREPLATFALTNSLAGFLAPWLIVALGVAAAGRQPRSANASSRAAASSSADGADGRTRLVVAVSATLVLGCLVLTKSRSAWLATLVGLGLLACSIADTRRLWNRRIGFVLGAGLLVGVGLAVAVRGLDIQVITEAGKSLGYRLEYWQSTLHMIADHPWLGVGPGNFQDYYTQYKLPQASEEISDPHNFLLEVWATTGTAALLALLAVFGTFAWQTLATVEKRTDMVRLSEASPGKFGLGIFVGAAVGFFLAMILGPLARLEFSVEKLAAGLVIGGVVVAGLCRWIESGSWPPVLAAVGLVVLSLNLLAAGGINYPGVANSFWLLLALSVNTMQPVPGQDLPAPTTRRLAVTALVLSSLAALGCYLTAYGPVLRATAAADRADRMSGQDYEPEREQWLALAVAADPLSDRMPQALAELQFDRFRRAPTEAARDRFERTLAQWLQRKPHASGALRQAGAWLLAIYEHDRRPEDARWAIECYQRGVDLYPNSASAHAELALALRTVDRADEAGLEAERALRLDDRMPHQDKKLSPALRKSLSGESATGESPSMSPPSDSR